MWYIFILLSLIAGLNASTSQLPTLVDWGSRCVTSDSLHKMEGLKEFLIDKDKTSFEKFCLKNNKIENWAEKLSWSRSGLNMNLKTD